MRFYPLSIIHFVIHFVACALLMIPSLSWAFDVPPNDGFVTDGAELLTVAEDEAFEEELRSYKERTDTSVVISIIDTLEGQPIEDIALTVGEDWGVGRTDDGQSVLILIAYDDRQIVIEPSPSLADILSEDVAQGIVREEMMPSFRDGMYAETVGNGITAVQKHLGGEYAADRYSASEGGVPWVALWKAFLLLVIGALIADAIATVLRPQTIAWLGALMGVLVGTVMALRYGLWLTIPVFTVIGALCDVFVRFQLAPRVKSRRQEQRRRRRRNSAGNDLGNVYEE